MLRTGSRTHAGARRRIVKSYRNAKIKSAAAPRSTARSTSRCSGASSASTSCRCSTSRRSFMGDHTLQGKIAPIRSQLSALGPLALLARVYTHTVLFRSLHVVLLDSVHGIRRGQRGVRQKPQEVIWLVDSMILCWYMIGRSRDCSALGIERTWANF